MVIFHSFLYVYQRVDGFSQVFPCFRVAATPRLRTQDLNKWIAATFSGRTIAINDQHVTPMTAQDVSQYEPGAEWPWMGMGQVSKLPDWGGTSIYQFFLKI